MGLIKTLTIGGEKYDIAADVKLASRGGLSKNADGEIGVYTGSGLYINSGNKLNVLLQDYGGLGVGENGLYINNNIPFDTGTIKWEETAYILGQNTRGNAYGVKYYERVLYSDHTNGLQLKFYSNDFHLGSYGLELANPGGGDDGINFVQTNMFDIQGTTRSIYFFEGEVDGSTLYTALKLGTAYSGADASDTPPHVNGLTYYNKIVPGFGCVNNGLSIYLLPYAYYDEPYLPLGFNNNGAICIRTSSLDSPGGGPIGRYSALQSNGDRVFINLYTLARQLTNFMEIREGKLIDKFDREV